LRRPLLSGGKHGKAVSWQPASSCAEWWSTFSGRVVGQTVVVALIRFGLQEGGHFEGTVRSGRSFSGCVQAQGSAGCWGFGSKPKGAQLVPLRRTLRLLSSRVPLTLVIKRSRFENFEVR
jgi:hypothetical protein